MYIIMAKTVAYNAPARITIENKSQNTLKLPIAGSPDQFMYVNGLGTATVTAQDAAQVAFYLKLAENFPVTVTVG